ncbi:MAG: spore cortex biosynthesis protein YabQ [Clostridia bacterium]|nr:spore cortex biosynthesis protein YabQ [Clostridia bacterium]MBQ7289201.1 spore cortex biosynthesis protein YabQ [Clostridia bacterium]
MLFGAVLALFYDIIKLLHQTILRSFIAIQVADVCFCLLSALLTFCFFMLASNGAIRFYLLLGELFGFILWSVICSAFMQKILLFIVKTIEKIVALILKPLQFLIRKAKKGIIWLKNKRNHIKNS